MLTARSCFFALATLALMACQPSASTPTMNPDEPTATPPAKAGDTSDSPPGRPASAPSSTSSTDRCAPHDELAELDPRVPVPLQPMMAWHQKQNMQEHLVAIQRINGGLARDDWDEVAAGAALIGSSPEMNQMCEHMGAGAEGFTELALEFHKRADKIAEAAEKRDRTAALAATANTLEACTGCHRAYRQEIVDARTWAQRTGQEHDPATMPDSPPNSKPTP